MNFIIQAIIRAFVPVLFTMAGKWLSGWKAALSHNSSRPYIDQIFDVLAGLAKDPNTPVPSQSTMAFVTGLKTIIYAVLDGGTADGANQNKVQPWQPGDSNK